MNRDEIIRGLEQCRDSHDTSGTSSPSCNLCSTDGPCDTYTLADEAIKALKEAKRFEEAWPMLADGVRAVISSAPFIVYRKDGQPGQVEFASDYGWTVWRSLESQDPEGWPVAVDECYSKKENIPEDML